MCFYKMDMYLENTADGLVPKARLVARGSEEKGLQEIPNDSPSCL